MPDYRAQYGAPAWLLTSELIGQELRTLYELPTELPPRLYTLARQLVTIDTGVPSNELPPSLLALVRRLDAVGGNLLLRRMHQAPAVRGLPDSLPPAEPAWL